MIVAAAGGAPATAVSRGASRPGPRPTSAFRRSGAWVVTISWSLAIAATALLAVRGAEAATESAVAILLVVNAVVWAPVSGLLLDRRPNAVGFLLAALSLGSAVSAVAIAYAPPVAGTDGGVLHAAVTHVWLPVTLAAFSTLPFLLVERPRLRATRGVIIASLVVSTLAFVASIAKPGFALLSAAPPSLPSSVQQAVDSAFFAATGTALALAVAGAGCLTWQWAARRSGDHLGLAWLVIGQWLLVLFFGPYLLGWIPEIGLESARLVPLALPIAQLFMPAAVLVAVLGRRLWGIDVRLNRALMWSLVIATLLVTYVSIAFALSSVFRVGPIGAGAVAVAVLAVGVAPARRWIQRRVDALIYGEAADPAQLVTLLGSRLSRGPRGESLSTLVEALHITLRLGYVAIESERLGETRASAGVRTGPITKIDLRSAQGVIGSVSASAVGDQPLDRRTRRILEQIAGVVSVASQFSDVNRDVEETRERIVDAREEEQRMVRRELQKGIAPALLRNATELADIRTLLHGDQRRAREALVRLRADLSARTNEVRDLARTLVPGALDSGDLEEALKELAIRFSSPQLTIAVTSSGAHELPPSLQAELYHIVAEAVLLVRRAPRATEATIAVERLNQHRTVVRIEHDGESLTEGGAAVLRSMGDRVEELGGRFEAGPRDTRGEIIVIEVAR